MSRFLDQAIAEAEGNSTFFAERCKATMSAVASGAMVPYAGMIASAQTGPWLQTPTVQTHMEQLRHFNGWVASAIRPTAQRIAAQPFRVAYHMAKRAKPTGKPSRQAQKDFVPEFLKEHTEDIEIQETHPLLDAVNNPNPLMPRWSLIFVTVAALQLTGKGYWWLRINEDTNKLEIWPLPPSWVEPKHVEGQLYHHWAVRPGGSGQEIAVPYEQIIEIRYPEPSNPLGAFSPLTAQSRSVVADESIAESQRRLFSNGIFPGYAITIGRHPDVQGKPGERPFLTRDQRQDIITAIKQAYRGVLGYDEPIILDGLVESIQKVSATAREMDFMKSGSYTKDRILQGFGVSPAVLGQLENANRAASATQERVFLSHTVNPIIELISQCLTMRLAPLFGEDDLLCYIEPCKAKDADLEMEEEDKLSAKGALSVKELRHRHGLAPFGKPELDDVCYVAATLVPIALSDEARKALDKLKPDSPPAPAPMLSEPGSTKPGKGFKKGHAVLDLPDIRQTDDFSCGAVALMTVATYYGVSTGDRSDYAALAGTTKKKGTSPAGMIEALKKLGLNPEPFTDDVAMTTLDGFLFAHETPILCPVQSGDDPTTQTEGHWVVVIGLGRRNIYLQDPVRGLVQMDRHDFVDRWHDIDADGQEYVRYGIAVHGPNNKAVLVPEKPRRKPWKAAWPYTKAETLTDTQGEPVRITTNIPAPIVNVNVQPSAAPPPQNLNIDVKAPRISVPPWPAITISPMPTPAPVVKMDAPVINVPVPVVNVTTPAPSVTVNVPEAKAPDVHIHVPEAKPIQKVVQRDREGNITGVVEKPV